MGEAEATTVAMWSEGEADFMRRALEVAERGQGRVSPNPPVGCVLVKDGVAIAEGWHDHLGGLHAEQMAIHDAEARGVPTNGATAYVTLEPCNHFGRTPPCTESLLWAGIQRVVVAHPDPNPNVRGRGTDVLREAGLEVEVGLLQPEAARQMRSFLHWCHHRRPWVTVKVAVDVSGSVDDRSGTAARFTSEGCLDEVHRLRQRCDAILVGSETVLRDNPSLTVRRVEHERQPMRVVLDGRGRIEQHATVLTDGGATMHLTGDVNLERLLDQLGDQEMQRLLVEGGPSTVHRFLQAGLVDEVLLVHSTVEHADPVPSGLDDDAFRSAGLEQHEPLTWGEERVDVWLRA
ncbi:MAG: bifunctional diaminohydroxyphosphoribosylaminopyrimidine deaminase/5-amino-6-(5-phosphoribosylamino)uracil reductase RibD [Candidatus Thermoplasmatota archaeon]|nr:bifunctional diaminohydroxyphosphoribosylaminopyrimidine deaminase/5-amino-6-(5-phosphoribosylamino)uracil reductase RibD [Candidatus Thermoplasmatota archaeon]MEC7460869.1 bifunctional diaminohydroxyphosphoribosylaminopyrimidine deaminase/5-amino-6-(5-phosphoribosylamino)uracil reductase RibD [Candidatus Thermoplasmatota archaeon]MEC7722911.1 bifunctional diaminohydroxyphosphoribosylaminopyrimidine deaminase/5-amino-6-(5-phosphoribosylamino)uracil reductase RibD [Candidatus Thermoplasmatota a